MAREVRTQKINFWWRWWDEAEHKSTPEKRLAFYDALMRYIFRGDVPPDPNEMENPTGEDYAAYDATHYFEVIDWMSERSSGGAPIGNQNARKKKTTIENNLKQPVETTENNLLKQNRETTKTTEGKQPFYEKKRNERENEREEEVEEEVSGGVAASSSPSSDCGEVPDAEAAVYTIPTRKQVFDAAALMGISENTANEWLEHMRRYDWHFSNGGLVTLLNFRTSLGRFAEKARLSAHEAEAAEAAAGGVTPKQRELIAKMRKAMSGDTRVAENAPSATGMGIDGVSDGGTVNHTPTRKKPVTADSRASDGKEVSV